jgi:putative mRNA 3-end processing factor
MRPEDLLCPAKTGLCVPPAGVHIDPMRPAERAIVTHGHSDHARAGHGHVLATAETLAIMAARYGDNFAGSTQAAAYGEPVPIGGGVTATFLPAGHVLGSAQVLLEWRGFRAVVSGDYKRQKDPTCAPFALARCHLFVTEATFGLPVFRHPDPMHEIGTLLDSVALFPERAHLVGAYALGKAQRLIGLLRSAGYAEPIYLHGAMLRLTELYQTLGVELGEVRQVRSEDRGKLGGAIVIAPVSALREIWSRRFPDPVNANASGWMRIRARARQCGVELPLVISDHADWPDLCRTILETEAEEVWVTHGEEDALVHWCTAQGLAARPLRYVGYGEEGEESAPAAEGEAAAGEAA